MRSLDDLKERVKPGVVFTLSNYLHPRSSGERVIAEVEEKGFWYVIPGKEGHGWIGYPDVTLLCFEGETVTIWHETTKAVAPAIMLDFTEEEEA